MCGQPELMLPRQGTTAGPVILLVSAFSSHLGLQLGRQALLGLQPLLQDLAQGGLAQHAACGVPDVLSNLQETGRVDGNGCVHLPPCPLPTNSTQSVV